MLLPHVLLEEGCPGMGSVPGLFNPVPPSGSHTGANGKTEFSKMPLSIGVCFSWPLKKVQVDWVQSQTVADAPPQQDKSGAPPDVFEDCPHPLHELLPQRLALLSYWKSGCNHMEEQ